MSAKKLTLLAAISCALVTFSGLLGASANDKAASAVTFEKDVAPIIRNKCLQCHRPDGAAPMSLVSYGEARPWARSIKEKVVTRVMPPFYASGPVGYYENDIRLTQDEINTISRWVDAGAPRGNPSNGAKQGDRFGDKKRAQPDLLLKMRAPYAVKNSGVDDYQYFAFDHTFEQDTWVRGIEVLPGNLAAVHHIGLYILPARLKPDPDGRIEGGETTLMGAQLLLFWNPGSLPRMFRDGWAMLIPKGSRLGIQVHYGPTTKENLLDQSSVGFYYANGVVDKMIRAQYGGVRKIEIPAGEKNYQLVDYRRFKTPALLTGFGAHMHLRGKSFNISLIYPDGRRETVFEMPKYYFYWQRGYGLAKPLPIPKGTVAVYTATYDNSAQNPLNPDPNQVVRSGEKTSDEMMGGSIVYVIPNEELGIHVKNGVKIDQSETAGTRPGK